MHRPIGEQILSRNSEPQYMDIIESCITSENEVSHTDGKPDIGRPIAKFLYKYMLGR